MAAPPYGDNIAESSTAAEIERKILLDNTLRCRTVDRPPSMGMCNIQKEEHIVVVVGGGEDREEGARCTYTVFAKHWPYVERLYPFQLD